MHIIHAFSRIFYLNFLFLTGSSEIFRLRVEAEKYKSKYNDAKQEIVKLNEEIQSLRERLGYIAAATNVLLPISSIVPPSVQLTLNSIHATTKRPATPSFSRSPTPPAPKKRYVNEKPEPWIQDDDFRANVKSYQPTPPQIQQPESLPESKLEPQLVLEKLELPKRGRGRPPVNYAENDFTETETSSDKSSKTPQIESSIKKTPVFTLDPKYPNITQAFLLRCHRAAEGKIKNTSKAGDKEFRDRTFVRLLFHEIYEIDELIGRSATGRNKRSGKRGACKEIDPAKKQFITDKLKERVLAIDPENIPTRTQRSLMIRWFSCLVTNRVNRHKTMTMTNEAENMASIPENSTLQDFEPKTSNNNVEDDDDIYEVYDESEYDEDDDSYMLNDSVKTEIVDYPKMSYSFN